MAGTALLRPVTGKDTAMATVQIIDREVAGQRLGHLGVVRRGIALTVHRDGVDELGALFVV